ncbi:MAG: type II CRISPR RNA-guided endonuclease Cas9, partial [Candidatus Acidiferrales bacterium]
RQLQDTRYTSKLAGRYLGLLYGGRDERQEDGANSQRVFNTPGALTADLRWHWCLEAILREAEPAASQEKATKPRGDHRHHAIDAIVVALTTPAAVKAMSDAAERNAQRGRTSIKGIEAPWPDFVESIRPHIERLVVSHRPEHKLSGPLHDETLYGNSHERDGKAWVHVRKPVDSLTAGDIGNIVDPRAREAVQKRLKELGSLKALQTAGVDPPYLETNDGRRIPIRRVRVRKALTTTQVGAGIRARSVAPNNNHHAEIVAELGDRGEETFWESIAVSALDAHERGRRRQAIVQREHNPTERYRFKFSLMNGDTLQLQRNGSLELWVVRSVWSNGQLSLCRANDARIISDIKKADDWWTPRADALRHARARKVAVDVLGRVHPAND